MFISHTKALADAIDTRAKVKTAKMAALAKLNGEVEALGIAKDLNPEQRYAALDQYLIERGRHFGAPDLPKELDEYVNAGANSFHLNDAVNKAQNDLVTHLNAGAAEGQLRDYAVSAGQSFSNGKPVLTISNATHAGERATLQIPLDELTPEHLIKHRDHAVLKDHKMWEQDAFKAEFEKLKSKSNAVATAEAAVAKEASWISKIWKKPMGKTAIIGGGVALGGVVLYNVFKSKNPEIEQATQPQISR